MKQVFFFQRLLLLGVFFLFPAGILQAGDDNVIITAEDISALQAHSMADILDNVPGLSAGSSTVSIHGNYKVKVFVDGRPINDPTSSHGGINWDMVSPSDIEQIEILRGKGSVRYGQDASGGVILITTKAGSKISGTLKAFGGSQERYYVNSNLQTTRGPWSSELSGGYETTDGYQVNNDKKRYQLGSAVGYTFNELAQLSFSANYTEDKRGYPDYPTPYSRAKSSMQAYSMQADLFDVTSKTYLNRGEKNNTDISRGLDQTIKVDDFGQQLDSSYNTKSFGDFSYGTAWYWSGASGTTFSDQSETTTSLYVTNSYLFSSLPVNLSFGVRANINSGFENAYNPEIKITYKAPSWKTTLGYNRANNTPSFYQRFNETSSTLPNPDLGMETSENYSLAVFSMLSSTVGGSMTLFYNRLSNRITYTYDDNGTGQYQNIGKATYTGGDVSLNWTPLGNFQCKINYTYLIPKDEETNKDLTAKPRHRGRITFTYKPTDSLSVILLGSGNTKAYRNSANTKSVPGYFTMDVKVQYDFEHFSLFTEATNILDKNYLYVDGMQAPPLAWFAGITFRI